MTRALLGEVDISDVLPVLKRAFDAPRDPAVRSAARTLAGRVPGDGPAVHHKAYAAFVDDNYFEGFVTLLKSLLLTSTVKDTDIVVLHDGLEPRNVLRARQLYPAIRFVRVDPTPYLSYVKGDTTNYLYVKAYLILDVFRRLRYDKVVTLDTDMVVLKDIGHLFDRDSAFAAVPQFFDSDGGRKLNSGLMVFDSTCMTDEFVARIDAVGLSGDYELERHDQGVLTAVLDGEYERLGRELNWVKRATRPGESLPEDVSVLHFTGRFKPWQGGEQGYHLVEERWHEYAVGDVAHMCRYVTQTPDDTATGTQLLQWYERLLAEVPADQRQFLAEGRRPTDASDDAAAGTVALLEAVQAGRFDAPLTQAVRYAATNDWERAELLGQLALFDKADGAEAFLANLS
ncbi:hypothetical protein HGK34_06205 [Myceligenerans sp. I2]|uniref:Uncharacterized protein n=1 Tax=Myceligenerans indicum TaxID=2593663 RepID=A0ABS1LJX0_9MICO|nr:hypothetical protein [Myceligenerans indicum]